MTDIHCHIMPYVDDGAVDMDEALVLLDTVASEGVEVLCLTPHLRDEMFTTPDQKIRTMFKRLDAAREEARIPLELHLSREYYFDSQFRQLLAAGAVIPLGNQNLLIEFSYSTPFEVLAAAADEVLAAGYNPIFAHVERYFTIQNDPEQAAKLIEMGVRLQLNTKGILGHDGFREKRTCKYLLKKRYVFAVASDTHDSSVRVPHWEKCRKHLEKKYGREYAQELMQDNPNSLFSM